MDCDAVLGASDIHLSDFQANQLRQLAQAVRVLPAQARGDQWEAERITRTAVHPAWDPIRIAARSIAEDFSDEIAAAKGFYAKVADHGQ